MKLIFDLITTFVKINVLIVTLYVLATTAPDKIQYIQVLGFLGFFWVMNPLAFNYLEKLNKQEVKNE